MGRPFKYRSSLERVYNRLSPIGVKIYTTSRPTAIKDGMSEFIIISIPTTIADQTAFQESFLRIEIFVREKGGGVDPINRLDELQSSVMNLFPYSDELIHSYNMKLIPGGADGVGFFFIRIQGKLLIK